MFGYHAVPEKTGRLRFWAEADTPQHRCTLHYYKAVFDIPKRFREVIERDANIDVGIQLPTKVMCGDVERCPPRPETA